MAVAGAPAGGLSWAKVAMSEPAKKDSAASAATISQQPTAVVDANAIMSGVALGSLAERLVTIPEVLEEVRDVKTRERLATLQHALETLEPSEEAIAAGRASHPRATCFRIMPLPTAAAEQPPGACCPYTV